jgi:hypothetical protein
MSNPIGNPTYATDLPQWKRYSDTDSEPNGHALWNASYDPPGIGTKVHINLNGWNMSSGIVVGYYPTGGWLMICVKPDTRPAWHVQEMPNRTVCLFAGIELELVK